MGIRGLMGDFAYINARVKVMTSQLLPPARVEELLRLPDLDAFMLALADTPYQLELHEALTRFAGVRAVDEAVAQYFYRTTRRILAFADGRERRLVEVILLRYDLQNIRAIVRGRHTGKDDAEILATLYPGGLLSEAKLQELLRQPELQTVADTLITWLHPLGLPLRQGLDVAQRSGRLLDAEVIVDAAYFRYGLSLADREGAGDAALRRFLGMAIAATNLKTALRLRRAKELTREARERFFIPGDYWLPRGRFSVLADPESSLGDTARVGPFGVGPAGADDPLEMERSIDQTFQREAARSYVRDPLALDVVIGFLARKAAEASNVRVIAHARALGLPDDRARQELFRV
jgi:V/A-type H+-transporting ATPase subunit C